MCAVGALAVGACGGDELVFPPWSLEVPEGTPVHGYAPVGEAERGDARISLEEELVVAGDADEGSALYAADHLTVSRRGSIYVLNEREGRVLRFADDGRYLGSFGRAGEGPGEIDAAAGMTIAGQSVVVADVGSSKLAVWSLTGDHLGDRTLEERLSLRQFRGTPAGELLATVVERTDESWLRHVVRLDLQGNEIARLASAVDETRQVIVVSSGGGTATLSIELPGKAPRFALGPGGAVYLSYLDEYQVLALDPSGDPVWALRVASPRPPFPQTTVDDTLESIRELPFPDFDRDRIEWPELAPAIDEIAVDGRGFLYVWPFHHDPATDDEQAEGDEPVDVYAPDGERVFAGWIPARRWEAAHGEHVYSLREDPESGEQEIVRYRVVTPY